MKMILLGLLLTAGSLAQAQSRVVKQSGFATKVHCTADSNFFVADKCTERENVGPCSVKLAGDTHDFRAIELMIKGVTYKGNINGLKEVNGPDRTAIADIESGFLFKKTDGEVTMTMNSSGDVTGATFVDHFFNPTTIKGIQYYDRFRCQLSK